MSATGTAAGGQPPNNLIEARTKIGLSDRPRGSTGSRPHAGSARSRFNALKHGILSSTALLDHESEREYGRLTIDLARTLQPVGKLEETEVEIIAYAILRYRRLLCAEAAEIGRARLMAKKTLADLVNDARLDDLLYGNSGSLHRATMSHDGVELQLAVRMLKELRERVLEKGLDWERDSKDLAKLFGAGSVREPQGRGDGGKTGEAADLPALYRSLCLRGEHQPRDAKSEASRTLVQELTQTIDLYEPLANDEMNRQDSLDLFRTESALVPEEQACDRLIRYEAHLERIRDRALARLERLQRLRLGQSVLPPLKVEVST
jgi:hypothetical protein